MKTTYALILLVVMAYADYGCGRAPQTKFAAFMQSGQKHLDTQDYRRAILDFRNASQVQPGDAEAHYRLALAYLGLKDYTSGAKALKKAIDLNPSHTAAQVRLADLMTTSSVRHVVEDAEKRLQDVLARSPQDPDALNTIAIAEARLGKLDDAEHHLRQVFESAPQNLRTSFNLAKLRLARGDVASAEAILKKVMTATSDSTEPVIALGALYAATGRREQAGSQFRRALEMQPRNGLALVSLAGLEYSAGRMEEAEKLYKQAAALDDTQYKPVYALFLFQSGRREQALPEFERLAKENPSDRHLRSLLVEAYEAVNATPKAERVLTTALEKNGRDIDALLQRSRLFLKAGKHKEARADLANVLHFRPDSGIAHLLMAKVHQKEKAFRSQEQKLGEALRVQPMLLPARIELARLLTSTNRAEAALDLLNHAPEDHKDSLAVLIEKNWALLVAGAAKEAAQGIDQALAIARNPDTLLQNAVRKRQLNDNAGAQRALEEVLKINPHDLRALDLTVQIYESQQRLPAAVERVREHVRQRPASAPLQVYLGQLQLKSGDRSEARKSFLAAKAADPAFTMADVSLAHLSFLDGRLDDVRKSLASVLAANPSDSTARLMMGDLETRSGNLDQALDHYRKAIEVDDRNILALNNYAFLLAESARPDEALKFATKAKELAPDNAAVDDTLGWILCRKGIYATAIRHLEMAVSREPSGLRKLHLATAYLKSGDRQKARVTLAAAQQMEPGISDSTLFRETAAGMTGQ